MDLEEVERQLRDANEALNIAAERVNLLKDIKARLRSEEFIKANGLTLADVELSSDIDVPWFGSVLNFSDWLREQHAPKPYAAWNGCIYRTSDLLAGGLTPTPVRLSDLK